MAKTTIDVDSLFAVLEAKTSSDGLSMRQAAALIGVSPSLLSRLRNGQRPDLDAFANIVRWLGVSADTFLISDDAQKAESVELNTEVSALLRARTDLSAEDKSYLEDIFRASLQHVRKTRRSDA
jgi:transcriptional regulator with XRE-family HTH domain